MRGQNPRGEEGLVQKGQGRIDNSVRSPPRAVSAMRIQKVCSARRRSLDPSLDRIHAEQGEEFARAHEILLVEILFHSVASRLKRSAKQKWPPVRDCTGQIFRNEKELCLGVS